MNIQGILNNVYHLHYPSRHDLTSSLLRFQEHYESSHFRGKVFSLEEFKEWYKTNSEKGKKTGKFTYYQDWGGFNFPSGVLHPFYTGNFDPLSPAEQEVLSALRPYYEAGKKFYVIGTFGKAQHSLKHEIAHALFYTDSSYFVQVLQILNRIPQENKDAIEKALEPRQHHLTVLTDEMHAYLLTNQEYLKEKGVQFDVLAPYQKELETLFSTHCPSKVSNLI